MEIKPKEITVWIEFGGGTPDSALKRLGPRSYHQGNVWFQRKIAYDNGGFFLHLDLNGWQNIQFRLHAIIPNEGNLKGLRASKDYHPLRGDNVLIDGLMIGKNIYNRLSQGYDLEVEFQSGWFTFTLHSDKE